MADHVAVPTSAPAGVVLVGSDDVRLLEWQGAGAEELDRFDPADPDDERGLRGPAPSANRAAAGETAAFDLGSQRDLHERRLHDRRVRWVRDLAAGAAERASERGWCQVLVAGDPRLAAPAAEELQRRGVDVVESDLVLGSLTPAQIHERARPLLAEARIGAQEALAERIRGEALAGGRGAIGVDDSRTTAAEGRVERLLLDPRIAEARELYDAVLAQGGEVLLAEGRARDALTESGGAAALLRW
jgi:hypothetical protein